MPRDAQTLRRGIVTMRTLFLRAIPKGNTFSRLRGELNVFAREKRD